MTYEPGELILDKYRIDTILGKGAYGDVYRITNLNLNVSRALKTLLRNGSGVGSVDFTNGRLRFRLEAQLGARFNGKNSNPNLLHVYDFTETNDVLMLEMEYAPEGNLSDRIQKYKSQGIPFPKEKALKIAFEIATGLTPLHILDIIHRNLKPANILFDQYDYVRIADLGFAQIPGGPTFRSLLNTSNPHPGTPGYMSPEQRQSSALLTPSSDVYSLGLVLFEMLSGQKHFNVRPRTQLGDLLPGIKPSLNDLLTRMLSESPKYRPFDGKEVANELHRELEAELLAQKTLQEKKRRELEEWERLKTEELARKEGKLRIRQETQTRENKEAQELVISKNNAPDQQESKNRKLEPFSNPAKLLSNNDSASHENETQEKVGSESADHLQVNGKLPSNWKRYWWLGIVVLLGIGSIPFIYGRIGGNIVQNKPTIPVQMTLTSGQVSSPIPNENPIVSNPPTQTPFEIPTDTPSLTPTWTLAPTQIPTQTIIPTEVYEVKNISSFEDTSGWVNKTGDAHIIGNYSKAWASQGSQSYQFMLFGDKAFEYCFTPGMRTTINQNVDLTNVDEVLFDMKIQPAVFGEESHGDNRKTNAVVFIDGVPIFESNEGTVGEIFDLKLKLNKKYSGMHEIKFGFMVKSKFCVKGRSETDILSLFIDNIRFIYK